VSTSIDQRQTIPRIVIQEPTMSVVSTAPTVHASAIGRLTAVELKLFLREKIGPIWGVAFPLVLLVIIGSIPYFNKPMATYGGRTLLDVYVPILIAFVIAMLALNAMPPVLAGYRERGVLRRMRTTPVGPVRVLTAHLTITLGVSAIAVILILAVARVAYGVALPHQIVGFVLAAILAAAALSALGLFVSAAAPSGRAANAIGAILFYPLMFFAGLWLPIAAMPKALQHVSHATPLGAAVSALTTTADGHWPTGLQMITLAAYALVFGVGAARLFRWE
jgi:ABC-2 type transport system permease protein